MSFDQDPSEQANISGADFALMVDEMNALRAEIEKCAATLPGVHYMDPPDGGSPTVSEQLQRMADDAARYRWLMAKLQAAYDGEVCDDYEVTVTCSMIFGRKEVRRVQAEISWFDERDELLNLSAAIDESMKKENSNVDRTE